MIKKLLMGTFSFTLILGVIAVAVHTILGINISYLTYEPNIGLGMWKYDYHQYLDGLETTLSSLTNVNLLQNPTIPNFDWSDFISAIKSLGNIFVVGINWIIFAFNALLALIKIVFYILIVIMCIFGINIRSIYIYDIAIKFYEIQIPYINPIT